MKTIDVIAPVYNEEACLREFVGELIVIFDLEVEYQFRLVLIENGSTDDSYDLICELLKTDNRIACVKLTRNFGMDGGITAGLKFATADAVIFMASDMQDPPRAIPLLLRKWEEGFDNVFAIVSKRIGVSIIRKMNSQIFYLLANRLTNNAIPRNVSDFRLLSRKAYEALRGLEEANRVIRGLVGWMGFKNVGIKIDRPPRFAGKSKAHTWPVIGLGVRAILSHSYAPLRLISVFGIVLSGLSMVSLVTTTILFVFHGVPFPGFGTIISVIILLFGILFLMLGIISEYLALVYEEVKKRPPFLIDEKTNVD